MKRIAPWAASVVCLVALAAALAGSAPQPSPVPVQWELDFQYQPIHAIQVQVPGESGKQTFWYVLYTVTNRPDKDQTGKDRMFVPAFEIYTDTGKILKAENRISPSVFKAIQQRHNNPLLRDAVDVTGTLLVGEDNAKDGVAIFRDIDSNARSFDLFMAGFSGETATVKLPTKIMAEQTDLEGNVTKVMRDTLVLHKTLDLTYSLPGEPAARLSNDPIQAAKKYVMR